MTEGSELISKSLQLINPPEKINIDELKKIIRDSKRYRNKIIIKNMEVKDRGQHGYQQLIANLALLNLRNYRFTNFIMLLLALLLINPFRPFLWCFESLKNRFFV